MKAFVIRFVIRLKESHFSKPDTNQFVLFINLQGIVRNGIVSHFEINNARCLHHFFRSHSVQGIKHCSLGTSICMCVSAYVQKSCDEHLMIFFRLKTMNNLCVCLFLHFFTRIMGLFIYYICWEKKKCVELCLRHSCNCDRKK